MRNYSNYKNFTLYAFLRMTKNFEPVALLKEIENGRIPKRILFWKIKKDLSMITIGQRYRLMDRYIQDDIFFSTFRILTGIPKIVLLFTRVKKIYPFVNHVIKTLESLNKRDERLIIPLTETEKKAGIDKMNHGVFGMIDSIVLRAPGVYSHEDVEDIPDSRVFKMLMIDRDKIVAQRNVNKVIEGKFKKKK